MVSRIAQATLLTLSAFLQSACRDREPVPTTQGDSAKPSPPTASRELTVNDARRELRAFFSETEVHQIEKASGEPGLLDWAKRVAEHRKDLSERKQLSGTKLKVALALRLRKDFIREFVAKR